MDKQVNTKGKKVHCPNCGRVIYLEGEGRCLFCTKTISSDLLNKLPSVEVEFKAIDTSEIIWETEPIEVDKDQDIIGLIVRKPWFQILLIIGIIGIFIRLLLHIYPTEITKEEKVIKSYADKDITKKKVIKIEPPSMPSQERFKYLQSLMRKHSKHYGNFPPKLSLDLNELEELGDVEKIRKLLENGKIKDYKRRIIGDLETYTILLVPKDSEETVELTGKYFHIKHIFVKPKKMKKKDKKRSRNRTSQPHRSSLRR